MRTIKLKPKTKKTLYVLVFDVLIIALVILYFTLFRSHNTIKIHGTYINNPYEIADFELIDQEGRFLERKNLKGHWSLLFFGFTNCPLVCPTTMAVLNKMYTQLKKELPANQLPQIIFISVDPARDTQKRLSHFVHSFNSHFIGARASTEEIIKLERQLHLVASKDNPVNHSMEILLVNPNAQVQAYFAYPHQAGQLAAEYQMVVLDGH